MRKKNNRKSILMIILVTLIAVFLMAGGAAILFTNHKRSAAAKEKQNRQALDALEKVQEIETVPMITVTPAPQPTETPTPKPAKKQAAPTPTAAPEPAKETKPSASGDYFFAESDSRYLTDEELSKYSSSDLELAKNEIYARRGRKFVTPRIAEYFESKAWYKGTIEPESFDAKQDTIFNEFEFANIDKIIQWEQKQRDAGK